MPSRKLLAHAGRLALGVLLAAALAGCGEIASGGGLAPGLTASMATPGANLDRPSAFGILNQYRATLGAGPLSDDTSLDATAQGLGQQYANTGVAPKLPAGASAMRVSAGYGNFAETFSGWRSSPADAAVLGTPGVRRAGLASVYDANSNYGVYWVLLLAN